MVMKYGVNTYQIYDLMNLEPKGMSKGKSMSFFRMIRSRRVSSD